MSTTRYDASMQHSIVSDIEACRAAWDRFSPKRTLFELWEFRFPFWEEFQYEPTFVLLEDDQGLLPLWKHPKDDRYLWFGDLDDECDWQGDCTFWAHDQSSADALLEAVPGPLRLSNLTQDAAALLHGREQLRAHPPKCVLLLQGVKNSDDYLQQLPKKLRQNMRRDQRRMQEAGMTIESDSFDAFLELVRMNSAAFEDSPFRRESIVRVFQKIIAAGQQEECPYRSHMLTAKIDDSIAAVDCVFLYKKTFYPLVCGSDTQRFSGVGNAMQLVDIDDALSLGMEVIDFAEAEFDSPKLKLFPVVPLYCYDQE